MRGTPVTEIPGSGNQENKLDAAGWRRHGFCIHSATVSSPPAKQENLLLNLTCNIAVPTLVLMKLSYEHRLGPVWALLLAVSFPLGYGLYDYVARKKMNFFSVVGLCSVLLTGSLGLLRVDGIWFAVKEAAIPLCFGAAVLISARTKKPLVRQLLWNEQVIDVQRVDAALEKRGQRDDFERLLKRASIGLALSFLLSAVLNFGLARYLLKSPAGTAEFAIELGRMNGLSLPVIMVPSMIVTMIVFWRLMSGLTQLTGLALDDIFRNARKA
jgi:hypothetical protein